MKKIIGLVCCSAFLFCGCGKTSYYQSNEPVEETVQSEETVDKSESSTIFIQVAGAVVSPGVYELSYGDRVYSAIEMAGGFLETADDSDINQAEQLTDGQKIYVYTVDERENLKALEESADDGLININTASVQELMTLPGIGEAKANQIVSYRESNGSFTSIEDIKKVSGIGDGIFNQINSHIKI